MKIKTLLLTVLIFTGLTINAQVNAGQVDDFENGTTMNWTDGGSDSAPSNVATGGPDGANDNYLSNPALGGNGSGSKMVMFNSDQWAGNYTNENIIAIKFYARALTNQLNLRVAFDGAGGRICTTNAVTVPANGSWQQYEIPISASHFTLVAGGSNIGQTLADVSDMRILSNTVPSWQGESIVATLEIDDIEASNTLSIDDFEANNQVTIVNLEGDNIKIIVPFAFVSQLPELIIYDLNGRKLLNRVLTDSQNIISTNNWGKGIYIVKLTTSKVRLYKKFVNR